MEKDMLLAVYMLGIWASTKKRAASPSLKRPLRSKGNPLGGPELTPSGGG